MEPGYGIPQLIAGSPHLSYRLGIVLYSELNRKRSPRPAGSLAKKFRRLRRPETPDRFAPADIDHRVQN